MPFTPSHTIPTVAPRRGRASWIERVLAALGVAIAIWGCDSSTAPAGPTPGPEPASDESLAASGRLQLEAVSDGGHYRISARPAVIPVELHQMHEWIVGIELIGDTRPIPTAVHFDGGMPSHGHGFVTQPRVTQNLGGGEFLIEGVKFHMPGDWVLKITVIGRNSSDQVTLPLTIAP